jgi:hypothetical protein
MSATAFADQARAASRDARRVIELVVQETAVDGRFTRFDGEPGPFARKMLVAIRKAGKRGRLRTRPGMGLRVAARSSVLPPLRAGRARPCPSDRRGRRL